jgi:hypothetical protein
MSEIVLRWMAAVYLFCANSPPMARRISSTTGCCAPPGGRVVAVGSRDHHDVARGRDAWAVTRDQGHELLDAEAFHVERAAPPDLAIADHAAER